MNNIQIAKSGATIVNGFEFNEYPAPNTLVKATNKRWAVALRDTGNIRLSSLLFYQSLENNELGDKNEGKGLFKLNNHLIRTKSGINEIYIWCASKSTNTNRTLLSLNESYDTILIILNVEEFIKRISNSLKLFGYKLYIQFGEVKYNRGNDVSKRELNSQPWHHNVFQKGNEFAHQNEYRLSFSNFTKKAINKKHLILTIGNCEDIIRLET